MIKVNLYNFLKTKFNNRASNIKVNGTPSAGVSNLMARADHVHPTDTSRENSSNKVTSISSSSTDTEYPSAKCVYDEIDALNELIGDAIDYING